MCIRDRHFIVKGTYKHSGRTVFYTQQVSNSQTHGLHGTLEEALKAGGIPAEKTQAEIEAEALAKAQAALEAA